MHILTSIPLYPKLWSILLLHPYSPHIHTRYEITHIHPNMTFQIQPIAYTTYIHTLHTYTIVKTRKKYIKNISQKGKILPFSCKIIQNLKVQNFKTIANFYCTTSKWLQLYYLFLNTYSNNHNFHQRLWTFWLIFKVRVVVCCM